MNYEVKIVFEGENVNYDFVKLYWKSLGYELKEESNSLIYKRGSKGYNIIANNPLKVLSKIILTTEKIENKHVFTCQVQQEKNYLNSSIMEQITEKEFYNFERLYNQSKINNVLLENVSGIKMQMVWPNYLLNIFFTGLGLLFIKRIDCIILGVVSLIYYLYGLYDSFVNSQFTLSYSFIQIVDSFFFWFVLSYIGHNAIRESNYSKYLAFLNNDQVH